MPKLSLAKTLKAVPKQKLQWREQQMGELKTFGTRLSSLKTRAKRVVLTQRDSGRLAPLRRSGSLIKLRK